MYDLDAIRKEIAASGDMHLKVGGKEFTVPPVELWPDSLHEALAADDIVGAGKALLGKQYAPFVKAGGGSSLLFVAIKRMQGVTVPES